MARAKVKFEHRLVLANWMLDLFGVAAFEDLAKDLRDPAFEGFDEDGISRFHQCLKLLFDRPGLSHDMLLGYDENIVRAWVCKTAVTPSVPCSCLSWVQNKCSVSHKDRNITP